MRDAWDDRSHGFVDLPGSRQRRRTRQDGFVRPPTVDIRIETAASRPPVPSRPPTFAPYARGWRPKCVTPRDDRRVPAGYARLDPKFRAGEGLRKTFFFFFFFHKIRRFTNRNRGYPTCFSGWRKRLAPLIAPTSGWRIRPCGRNNELPERISRNLALKRLPNAQTGGGI